MSRPAGAVERWPSGGQIIRVEFELSFRELCAAAVAAAVRAPLKLLGWMLPPLTGLLLLVRIVVVCGDQPTMAEGAFILACILFPVIMLPTEIAIARAREVDVRKAMIVSVSDAGVHVETATAEGTYKWAAIRRIVETRSLFLLYVSRDDALVVPKRSLGAGEIEPFRELLERNTGTKGE